ncbi:ABC transporter permease, partial [Marivirga lumbricoides]
MRKNIILLIARHFWTSIFKSKILYTLFGVIIILLFYAAYSGVSYHDQNHFRTEHQEMARQSWEANPDKHPHRMAHFGTFAFRIKYPLSIFDFGIESYTGNAIFLEAHKQNMVNFSDAGFSTGLLRFGEL